MLKLNKVDIKFTKFSNNETKLQLDKSLIHDSNRIIFTYEDDSSLMELYILKKTLDELYPSYTELFVTYMPYSRMDRGENGVSFTLKFVSDFINSMNFDKVFIVEPHSDVCLATINKSEAIYITQNIVSNIIDKVDFDKTKDYLFFPDAGAMKRYSKMFPDYKYLVGFKSRDFDSGDIDKLEILGNFNHNSKIIIVDDLCSGGRTFAMSASKLKEVGCDDIYLVVAHCENAVFDYGFLNDVNVKKVFTTDSIIKKQTHDKVETVCL